MQAIKFDNVSFSYDEKVKVVDGLSLEIEKGEFVAVVGRNGSGKSTVAKLINGLLTPDSGQVTVDGIDTAKTDDIFSVRSKVGMVFQNPDNQMVATIVEDDVAFGPENLGVERGEIGRRIDFALDSAGISAFRDRASSELSGGQKQRVAIAGVLAMNPEMTILIVTHYMDEATDADRVIVFDSGKAVFSGTPREVFSREDDLIKCGLCLPNATYIFNRLKERGVIGGDVVLTEEELEKRLCEYYLKG